MAPVHPPTAPMIGHPAPARATAIAQHGTVSDHIELTHDQRHLRRRLLTSEGGRQFLVDLGAATVVSAGECFMLDDGSAIAVRAAREKLIEASAPSLARLAWHIGNRHIPCQIESRRILVCRDHVTADLLHRLGATLCEVEEPFCPEAGAYDHAH